MSTADSFKYHRTFPFFPETYSAPSGEGEFAIGPITLVDAMAGFWKVEKVSLAFNLYADTEAGPGPVETDFTYDFLAINQPRDRVCGWEADNAPFIDEQTTTAGCEIGLQWPQAIYPIRPVTSDGGSGYYFQFKQNAATVPVLVYDSANGFLATLFDYGPTYTFPDSTEYEKIASGDFTFFDYIGGSLVVVPYYIYGFVDFGPWRVGGFGLNIEPVYFDFA